MSDNGASKYGNVYGVRPSIKRVLNQRRLRRSHVDLTLGSKIESNGASVGAPTQGGAALVAPAIGADVLIVARGLEPGSVFLAGSFVEGTDYTIIYDVDTTSLHNLAITPGTALDVIYMHSEGPGATGGAGGGLPRECVLADETVTIGRCEQMPVYQEIAVSGTLVVRGSLIIYE